MLEKSNILRKIIIKETKNHKQSIIISIFFGGIKFPVTFANDLIGLLLFGNF